MKIYNSLTNNYFDFNSLKSSQINWYCCGPTIYNDSHLGHARTYLIFDSMIRFLRSQGFNIVYGMNITDVDDKIINKVNKIHHNIIQLLEPDFKDEQISKMEIFEDFIKKQETHFWNDLEALNIEKPNKILRVTDTLDEIINYINILVDKDFAYVGNSTQPNKSIYFNVEKYTNSFDDSCLNMSNCFDQITKNTHLDDKHNHKDFALWKADNANEISWNSGKLDTGYGRPGWHIECSVMMNKMFGSNVHIHSGGIDLKYPHHNNEFLQSTCYHGHQKWINCFIHSGHLHVNGEKMSQSLGNFITIRNFLKLHSANEIRLMFLSVKYNQPMDLNEDLVNYGKTLNKRFANFLVNVNYEIKNMDSNNKPTNMFGINKLNEEFNSLLSNDFNTPEALKLLLNSIDQIYGQKLQYNNLVEIYELFSTFFSGLGFNYQNLDQYNDIKYNNLVDTIINIRGQIKQLAGSVDKSTKIELFKLTDKIRDQILPELNIKLDDLPNNKTKWYWV